MDARDAMNFMELFRSGKFCIKVNSPEEVEYIFNYIVDKGDMISSKHERANIEELSGEKYICVNTMNKYKELDGFNDHYEYKKYYIEKQFSEFKEAVELGAYYSIAPQPKKLR